MYILRALIVGIAISLCASTSNGETSAPPAEPSRRAVPDDNLAYPVRVEMHGSRGSGFFLNSGKATYFVTSKHVLFSGDNVNLYDDSLTLESYSKDPNEVLSNLFVIDLGVASYFGNLLAHPIADVALVKIASVEPDGGESDKYKMVLSPGVSVRKFAPLGVVGANVATTTKRFDQVKISNDVFIFGYPSSIGLAQEPQIDQTRPLIRKGIVAGLNRALRTIILDCEVFPGNSGGMVLEVEDFVGERRFRVIGMVSQYVPFDNARFRIARFPTVLNSGYTVVTPIDFALDLIGGN